MRRTGRCSLLLLCLLSFSFGCVKTPPANTTSIASTPEPRAARRTDMDQFFVEWLVGHGHKDVVVDSSGVGIAGNATRLRAGLYDSNRNEKGFVVEVEFSVQLPNGREIVEFVAGNGATEKEAINDAMLNFTVTTFHVIYKGLMNDADPHMRAIPLEINGKKRDVIAGDILMRGTASTTEIDLHAVRNEIQGLLKNVALSPELHWIKIVYGQNDNVPVIAAATLDNADHPGITDGLRRLNWPRRDGFYMAKQFIIIK